MPNDFFEHITKVFLNEKAADMLSFTFRRRIGDKLTDVKFRCGDKKFVLALPALEESSVKEVVSEGKKLFIRKLAIRAERKR